MAEEMERKGLMGERLLKLRNQSSLTQEELAERLDVSRQSISKWELNKTLPDVDKLIQLSEMYQVSIDYLIKGKEVEKQEEKKQQNETEIAVNKHSDKATGDEEKTRLHDVGFANKQVILMICIFLSGLMCLCMAVLTGRLLVRNAFGQKEEASQITNVEKIYEQYTRAEVGAEYGEKKVVWLDIPGVREGDYVFCYSNGEKLTFDYYSKTLLLPMIFGIIFLIFFIVFFMEWRLFYSRNKSADNG